MIGVEKDENLIARYMKAEDNKNLLVPDPYAARVVCDIFRMRLEGASASKIASELNRLGILSPLAYKKNNGLPYAKKGYSDKTDCKWSATTIIRILQDETYTGTLVQGKQGTPHYKIKQMEQRPASEWVRVPDAHEALIARQDFELVQRIKGLDTRTSPNEDTVYLFSGILICGCCGSRMTRKTNHANGKEYHYYYCPTGKKKGCSHPVMLKESSLIDCVRDSLKAYIGNIASLEALLTGLDQTSINQALAKEYSDHITDNERRLEQVLEFKARLYHRPCCRRCRAADVPLGFRGRWPEYHCRAAERSRRSHPQPLQEDAGQDHPREFARQRQVADPNSRRHSSLRGLHRRSCSGADQNRRSSAGQGRRRGMDGGAGHP